MRKPRVYNNGRCPECGGDHLVKGGFGFNKYGKVQRYVCMDCRFVTIKPIRHSPPMVDPKE